MKELSIEDFEPPTAEGKLMKEITEGLLRHGLELDNVPAWFNGALDDGEGGVVVPFTNENEVRLTFGVARAGEHVRVYAEMCREYEGEELSTAVRVSRELGQESWMLDFVRRDTVDGGIIRLGKDCGLDTLMERRSIPKVEFDLVLEAFTNFYMV